MKIVSIKSNILILIFYSCQINYSTDREDKFVCEEIYKDSVLMFDHKDTTGVFMKFPFIENKVYLLDCNDTHIELSKVLTNKSINYMIDIWFDKFENTEFKLPIFREVNDFSPILRHSLDSRIEKLFFQTPKNSFIVEFEYGTDHVLWQYLYKIDKNIKKVYLTDIFYSESIKNIIKNSYENKKDTVSYFCRFPIIKPIEQTPYKYIDSLFHHFDKISNKEEKWLIQ